MHELRDRVLQWVETSRRIALVGTAKNCGKTTTLNAMLGACESLCVGLVSIGIDGESSDLLIGTAKPTIEVTRGMLVATATGALEQSAVDVEYVEPLNIRSPLGQLVIARVLSAGRLILAGVRHRRDVCVALDALERHGAQVCFVDGAYGRTMAAHHQVCDGVVVCTGAILSRDIEQIAQKTHQLYARLTLAPVDSARHRACIEAAIEQNRALLGTVDGRHIALPARSALIGLSEGQHLWADDVEMIAIPGLVSDRVVEALLSVPTLQDDQQRTLVVADGTNIQCSMALWSRLVKQWRLESFEQVRVLAVSVNPTSVAGYSVDEVALTRALRWAEWVFNPLYGGAV